MKSYLAGFQHLGEFCSHSHKLSNGSHLCKFYENKESLVDTFCNYIVPSVTRGDGIIIIATPANKTRFIEALERRSVDVTRAIAIEQMVILDAEETLSLFMEDVLPDANRFKSTMSPIIDNIEKNFTGIRAYGEMVNVLWERGNFEGAIQLETLWNSLARDFSFTLLCAYDEQNFGPNNNAGHASAVCMAHSHTISHADELQLTGASLD